MSRRALGRPLVFVVLTAAAPAGAIPAFARKHQTSCLTCHTVYPKLKLIAVFDYESAKGFPSTTAGPLPPGLQPYQGGATPWGALQVAPPSSGENNHSEFDGIGLFLAWAM